VTPRVHEHSNGTAGGRNLHVTRSRGAGALHPSPMSPKEGWGTTCTMNEPQAPPRVDPDMDLGARRILDPTHRAERLRPCRTATRGGPFCNPDPLGGFESRSRWPSDCDAQEEKRLVPHSGYSSAPPTHATPTPKPYIPTGNRPYTVHTDLQPSPKRVRVTLPMAVRPTPRRRKGSSRTPATVQHPRPMLH
jgi:hypothetical protein